MSVLQVCWAYDEDIMNRQQIAQIYDEMPKSQQNMPRAEFIQQVMDTLNPNKMMQEADTMARGRIRRAQIDAALGRGKG